MPLRKTLERAGHTCIWPRFGVNFLVGDELAQLAKQLDVTGPVVLVGHSAGGLLAVTLARAEHPNVRAVIGLGTPLAGKVVLDVPYYECRSILGSLLPIWGALEVKRFLVPHTCLPLCTTVHHWIIEKLRQISLYNKMDSN